MIPHPSTQPELEVVIRLLSFWRPYLLNFYDKVCILAPTLLPGQPFVIVWSPAMAETYQSMMEEFMGAYALRRNANPR